nr:alkylphosphonate utilization protein [Leptotrichia sp. oral taxon 218]
MWLTKADTSQEAPASKSGSSSQRGTKVKNIRLIDDGIHNIDCKIDGFGAMKLKSEFVKKN